MSAVHQPNPLDDPGYKRALYNAAMFYISRGLAVIPLGPVIYQSVKEKTVRPLITWSKPENLITRTDQVEKWFGPIGAGRGLALATGDLLMIDQDNYKDGVAVTEPPAGAWVERHDGRGGWHAYMRNPAGARNTAGAIAAGIDTRGVGGLSVCAPTRAVHPDGTVTQWVTDRPLTELLPDQLPEAPTYAERAAPARRLALAGEVSYLTQEEADASLVKGRKHWLEAEHGGLHHAMGKYLGTLARYELAMGTPIDQLYGTLEAAVNEHPYCVAGEDMKTAEGVITAAHAWATARPWVIGPETGLFAPGAGESPPLPAGPVLGPDDDDPDVFTDEDYDGLVELPEPAYGGFGGGLKLMYPDKVHWLQGESGSGKSWVALAVAAELAAAGQRVWIIDYENSRIEFVGRLKSLGVTREQLRLITYTAGTDILFAELRGRMVARTGRYGLVIVDGVSSALTAMGKSSNDAQEFGEWFDAIPRRARMAICIDHVVKSLDDRRGMAIGTQAKKGRPGVSYEVRSPVPFKRGKSGTISLTLHKDRYGGLPISKGDEVVLSVSTTASGDMVRLAANAPDSGLFAPTPNASLFSSLYANGITASVSVEDLSKAVREAGGKVRNNERAQLRDQYRTYWADRQNSEQPVDNPVDNSVP